MRHVPVTGRWVIYALSLRKRPGDIAGAQEGARSVPVYDERCPFCPGHEKNLTHVLLECRGEESLRRLRVVENKYPALTQQGDLQRARQGMYLGMEGYGHHEVVIESPAHNRRIPSMSEEDMGKTRISTHGHDSEGPFVSRGPKTACSVMCAENRTDQKTTLAPLILGPGRKVLVPALFFSPAAPVCPVKNHGSDTFRSTG